MQDAQDAELMGGVAMQKMLHSDAIDVDGILKRNADMVYRLAFARAHHRQDAEDIFQDVFLRYVRRVPRFADEDHEKAWFIRVTMNCIKSYYGRADRRHTFSSESLLNAAAPQGDDFALLLLSLPPAHRMTVHLFYAERMSVRQIAKLTGRSENAVRVCLTRARHTLRQSLQQEVRP